MKGFLITILFLLIVSSVFPQHENTNEGNKSISFTLNDRDRIIRTEEQIGSLRNEMGSLRNEMNSLRNEMNSLRSEMNSLRNEINARFESINKRIDTLYWILGIIVMLVLFNLGYSIWDRRTALNPIREQTVDVSQKVETLIKVLREESKTNKKLAEILQSFGLL